MEFDSHQLESSIAEWLNELPFEIGIAIAIIGNIIIPRMEIVAIRETKSFD
jgi:hypothetical protein